MNLDLKEVRGQGNVLWNEIETFDIIVDLSSFYYNKGDVEEFSICAEYYSGLKSHVIIPKPVEKKIKLSDIPCGEKVKIYFLMKTNNFSTIPFYMNFYNEITGKNQSEYYELMGYPTPEPIKYVEMLITNGHKSSTPMGIKLISY